MEQKFHNFITDQINALKLLYDKQLLMPFLMVFYATIDILGYISDKNNEQEINKRFQAFVKKYMSSQLPNVDPIDLWAARCGVLHKCSPISKLSQNNKAKEFLYSWGTGNVDLAKKVIDASGKNSRYLAFSIEELYDGLLSTIDLFMEELKKDPNLYSICQERVLNEFYCSMSYDR